MLKMQASILDNKINYALFIIYYVAQNQMSVEITDIDRPDGQFIEIKREADKIKILEQVKSTGVIPSGVGIVQGTHLVIR